MSAAVVTGASRRIGQRFARALAKRGYDLVLIARVGPVIKGVVQRPGEECAVAGEVCRADLSTPGICLLYGGGPPTSRIPAGTAAASPAP